LSNKIKETDCCLRGRLSVFFNIAETPKDWFSLKTEFDIERVRNEMLHIITVDIIPFFQKVSNYDELYNAMILFEKRVLQKELHQIYIACVEFVMGKKEEAKTRLSKIENAVWAEKAKEVAKRMF